ELLPLRVRDGDGLGALHDHPGLLAPPVPAASRIHGVLMDATPVSGPTRSRVDRSAEATGRTGAAAARRRGVLAAVIVVAPALGLMPAARVLVTSLKHAENIIRMPPEWIPWPPTLAHYVEVLFSSSRTARIGRAFLNSVIVSLSSVAVVVITSAM